MTRPLLETKIRMPPITQRLVNRSRLIEKLETEISLVKIATLSAPAGYGKTTLLAQWAHSSHHHVVWLSLDDDDDEFGRFFRYLVAAWERAQPDIKETELALLASAASPDSEALLTAFINVGLMIRQQTVFVLDDVHCIEDASIHDALLFLLDHLPATLHLLLASRGRPPLPVARYRARRELLELDTGELQFLPEETDAFLNDVLGLDLTREQLTTLHHQMEGWAAGLQLAALILERGRDFDADVYVTGQHRYIAEYLAQDVFARLPNGTRQLLIQTSILESFNAELCAAVTTRKDARAVLDQLERDGLFLTPLDDQRQWYRYHPIFASFLGQELKRARDHDDVTLHCRAARWYLAHELPEPAFRHALAGEDRDLIVEILEHHAYGKVLSGEIRTVQRWLDSLPPDWLERQPTFQVFHLMLLLATGAFEAVLRQLDELERRLSTRPDQVPAQRGRLIAFRCFVACFRNDLPAAQEYANQALQLLSSDDFNFRPGVYGALGDTFRRNGLWDDAYAWYLKVLDFAAAPPVRANSVHLFGALADLNLRQGRLKEADRYWRQALSFIENPEYRGQFPLPLAGWVDVRMSELRYEWNALEDARELLRRGQKWADVGGDVRTLIAAQLMGTRLSLADGNADAAADCLERARDHLSNAAFPEWVALFDRMRIELWLARNRLGDAFRWAEEFLRQHGLNGAPEQMLAHLTVARVLTFTKDRTALDRARPLLDEILEITTDDGRMGLQIEALALTALAHWQRGETASALRSLDQALRLAEPEGYVRLFIDLGPPMALLLREAHARGLTPAYVKTLLGVYGVDDEAGHAAFTPMPEPLTDREQEIVRLLAIGLTNAEIAGQLFISSETVKKHAGNIYAKLGVHNRTEAVARARELDLLV